MPNTARGRKGARRTANGEVRSMAYGSTGTVMHHACLVLYTVDKLLCAVPVPALLQPATLTTMLAGV